MLYNHKITKNFRNPGKMYVKMTSEDLDEFFSSANVEWLKYRCKNQYTITDIKRGILEANHLKMNDDDIHTLDLFMALLGKYEDLEKNSLSTPNEDIKKEE